MLVLVVVVRVGGPQGSHLTLLAFLDNKYISLLIDGDDEDDDE